MSGLFALLDDVAAIAKVAAASVDDVAAQAAKASSKAAGIVIDDAAVTPKYVTGFKPARELPMIWRIARGSLINKLIFLLPVAILLQIFAPWMVAPLLILGGCYLCFEGAEKVYHAFVPHDYHTAEDKAVAEGSAQELEEKSVKGAIKTDFILSAEIMTILLSNIETDVLWMKIFALALAGVGITIAVYGVVAIIVKMDDVGLWMTRVGKMSITRKLGHGIVAFMPWLLKTLSLVGLLAMLWVGGAIIIHSLHQMGWHAPEDLVHEVAHSFGHGNGFLEWAVKAVIDGILGLLWGLILIPITVYILMPLWGVFFGKGGEAAH